MTTYYIGADVHSNSTELAIEKRNKIVARYTLPTTIPALCQVPDSLQGKKYLTFEEGPMAGWLYRNRVRDAVRNINKIRARCRMYGLTIPRAVVREPSYRRNWLTKLNYSTLAKQLRFL